MNRRLSVEIAVFAGLIVAGSALRVALRDIPNFAPVAALALFSGYFFRRRQLSVLVPLAIMALSDLWIGGYDLRVMATVYAMLALPVALGGVLRHRLGAARGSLTGSLRAAGVLGGASLASSVVFFLTTNLAVWACFDLYAETPAGLWTCYVQALPFFRYTLAGDLFFASALFGGYAFVTAMAGARSPAPVAVE